MTHNENEYGTRWLRFYVYWRFPIGFFISAVTILGSYDPVFFDNPILLAVLLLDLGVLALRIAVYFLMRRMRTIGYRLNFAMLVFDAFVVALNEMTKDSPPFQSKSLTFVLSLTVMLFVWIVPNFIYFRHRSYLFPFNRKHPFSAPYQRPELKTFIDIQKESVIVENDARPDPGSTAAEPVRLLPEREKIMKYCRSCGAPLTPGANFCTNCGLDLQTLFFMTEGRN